MTLHAPHLLCIEFATFADVISASGSEHGGDKSALNISVPCYPRIAYLRGITYVGCVVKIHDFCHIGAGSGHKIGLNILQYTAVLAHAECSRR